MTKRLILMRHAKSEWGTGAPDHARTLNPRGRRSAVALGAFLRHNGYLPDEVLCSDAVRTRETLAGLDLPPDTPVRYLRALYHADVGTMLALLRGARGDCVLMVGHNPGIAFCAHRLLTTPPDHHRFDDYPTGATLVADFDLEDWADLLIGTGTAVQFVTPRDLDAETQ